MYNPISNFNLPDNIDNSSVLSLEARVCSEVFEIHTPSSRLYRLSCTDYREELRLKTPGLECRAAAFPIAAPCSYFMYFL